MRLRKTLKTKRTKSTKRTKRQAKPKVKRTRTKRIVQRAVDNIVRQIRQSEEYQEYVDERRDWEIQDIAGDEGFQLELEDGTEVDIVVEPVANSRYSGFRTFYIVEGRPRVPIQTIRTGPGIQEPTDMAVGA